MGEWSIKNGPARRCLTQELHRWMQPTWRASVLRCTGVAVGLLLLWGQSTAHAHLGHLGMAEQLVTMPPNRAELRGANAASHASANMMRGAAACASLCVSGTGARAHCLSPLMLPRIGLARALDHLAKGPPLKDFSDLALSATGADMAPRGATGAEAGLVELPQAAQC